LGDAEAMAEVNIRATDMADLRRARPERQIAFKFELETAISILKEVEKKK
jgi:DNA ligase (NAD+)